ncbi:MAG: hypothetical protein QM636_01405 [Rhizobium sp.]
MLKMKSIGVSSRPEGRLLLFDLAVEIFLFDAAGNGWNRHPMSQIEQVAQCGLFASDFLFPAVFNGGGNKAKSRIYSGYGRLGQ